MTRAWLVVLVACATPQATPKHHAPRAALPAPPQRLPRTFEPSSYAVKLEVDPEQERFHGEIEIAGQLGEPTQLIWLHAEDLDIERAHAGAVELVVRKPAAGYLALWANQPLARGPQRISIRYAGRWNDKRAVGGFRETADGFKGHGEHYVFTMFEADYARRVFPCFDEPDRKVPWQLTLTVPRGQVAVGNAPIASERVRGNLKVVEFAPTLPLPSYLVAFAVGPFDVVDGRSAGVPVRVLTPRGQASRGAEAAKVAGPLIDQLASWLGVPFPYPKLDVVAVPETADFWAAMENAGLIAVNKASIADREILAHEIAHHWFGDLVTPAWWDDVWLNESFAYWIGDKIDHLDEPMPRFRAPFAAVRFEVIDPRSAFGGTEQGMLDANARSRAGIHVLEAFQRYLGRERFRNTMELYLSSHAHGIVRTADLGSALAKASGEDLAAVLDAYMTGTASTQVAAKLGCNGSHAYVELSGVRGAMFMCLAYDHDGARRDRCVVAAHDGPIDLGTTRCSEWFLAMSGFSKLQSDDEIARLAEHGWATLSEQERLGIALWPGHIRWELVDKLARSSNNPELLAMIAGMLQAREHVVAPALVDKYRAWLRSLFAMRARTTGFHARSEAQIQIVELAAIAGDATLQRQAVALAATPDLPEYVKLAVLRVAVRADRHVAEKVFDKMLTMREGQERFELATTLRGALDIDKLVAAHEAALGDYKQYLLDPCNGGCAKTRDEIEPGLRAFLDKH